MASPPGYIPSDYSPYDDSAYGQQQPPSVNSKIMVASIVVLLCVIFFISSLHIFGKWLWRSSTRSSNRQHLQLRDEAQRRHAGLSKATIALLPTFTYTAHTMDDTNVRENARSLECAVCLSEFQESEKGRMLPACKHSFHIECIDMWLYSHSTCPLCRAVVMPTNTTSPWIPSALLTYGHQEIEQEEEAAHEIHITIDSSASSFTLEDDNMPAATAALPNSHNLTNALESSSSSQVGATHINTENPSYSTSITTRCVPHITIEIPTRQDIRITSPGCISLPSRRLRCLVSPQSCSSHTSVQSPGIRVSLKRI